MYTTSSKRNVPVRINFSAYKIIFYAKQNILVYFYSLTHFSFSETSEDFDGFSFLQTLTDIATYP